MALVEVAGMTYHMNNDLKRKWDKIKDGYLKKIDNDKVYIVDGRERTGKSTFALQQACYIDPTLVDDISRICFSADEFLEAIRKTDSTKTQTKCVVFDEAFRGLSSRGATSKINKKIIQALMEVGQKNLVIFIVLPSFFMLDLYVAMLRSNALFHVTTNKRNKKRTFYVYPHHKKGKLYQDGVRKGWNYKIFTKAKGYFYAKFPRQLEDETGHQFYVKYLEKKRKSLVEENQVTVEVEKEGTNTEKLKKACYKLVKIDGQSLRGAQKILKGVGFDISHQTIKDYADEVEKRIEFEMKKAQYVSENLENMSIVSV